MKDFYQVIQKLVVYVEKFLKVIEDLKGNLRSKKSLAQMKEREKCKKRAITDLNAPYGSRDIPFQSQEFEQYGRRHFVDF